MNPLSANINDFLGMLVSLGLTLMVFSYLLGDNFLLRLALHIFVGTAAGYAASVAWYNVIWTQLVSPLLQGGQTGFWLNVTLLLLCALLMMRISPVLAPLSKLALAFMAGVGMAAAVGGAITGTILPQTLATINLVDLMMIKNSPVGNGFQAINGGLVFLGTITSLAFFHFTTKGDRTKPAPRTFIVEVLAGCGQVFIAAALGFLFAGAYSAALTALVSRISFVIDTLLPLLLPK